MGPSPLTSQIPPNGPKPFGIPSSLPMDRNHLAPQVYPNGPKPFGIPNHPEWTQALWYPKPPPNGPKPFGTPSLPEWAQAPMYLHTVRMKGVPARQSFHRIIGIRGVEQVLLATKADPLVGSMSHRRQDP